MILDETPEVLTPNPEKILPSHFQRLAVIYVRQSTAQQILNHEESTRLQYGLMSRAQAMGWTRERILVIDDDLGKSAASSVRRVGFERLVSEVGLGHVGMILGVEMSRLARSSKDWHQLLEICALFGTLISDLDGVYDASQYNDRLLLGLKGTMSEAELHIIKQRMHQGKLSKARRGELALPVPIGYIRRPSGEVVLDPDEEVQQIVSLVFRKFEELGTVRGVLRYLVENGLKLGVRVHEREGKGELQWRKPNRTTLQNMLNNPIYAGVYAYGRRRMDPRRKKPGRPSTGYVSRLKPSEEWHVMIKDHLPAYLSWEHYEKNLERLAANQSRADTKGAPGRGISLLQGMLVCGRCGARMNVRYGKGKGREHHVYFCSRLASDYGGKACQNVSGPTLDEFVTRKVLEALKPAALELSLAAAKHVEREREELDHLWHKRLERASYEAERAGRHYRLLEPENRLVARQLARDWEHKLAAQQRLEEEYRRFLHKRLQVLTESERTAIRRLAEDIPALWEAITTTNKDRKEIIRQILDQAMVEVEGKSERVKVRFEWAGGTPTEDLVIRPVAKLEQLSYYPELCEHVRRLAAQGLSAGDIAERLNKKGYRTPIRRGEFRAQMVGDLMRRLGWRTQGYPSPKGQEGLLDENEWWLSELATEVGMPKVTLYRWIRRGWVRAHQQRERPRRWIVWADEKELERVRQQVENSDFGKVG